MLDFSGFVRAAVLISLVLCSAWSAAAEIRVGQSIDMSGVNGDLGKDFLAGARVYIDSINSAGGVHGKKIMLDVRDNQGSVEKSNQITHDFLTKDKVDVLFGYYGDNVVEATLALPEFVQSGTVLVAPFSGVNLGKAEHVYFMRPSYTQEIKAALDYVKTLGLTKVAVVYADNAYGKNGFAAAKSVLQSGGVQLVAEQLLRENNDADTQAAIRKIKTSRAQATLMILETLPAADFVKTYHPLSPGALLLGLSQINHQTLVEIAGKSAAGVVITQVVPHPASFTLSVVRELDKAMKKYRDEAPSHLTMEGYLAAKWLVKTLMQADAPKQLNQALMQTRNLDLGGYYLTVNGTHRASEYVDITAISTRGGLLH
ncbi:MAG: ABC transporter substrate-binding protein [Sulfuriferula sp.]|nr:ABC transporter substrate-binding protein [Sulfuriferula sp.]